MVEKRARFEINTPTSSSHTSYDVLKAQRGHVPETSASPGTRDVGTSKKEMYENIIGGDYTNRFRKQKRLNEIKTQFETTQNYIERNWHRIGDSDFGKMTRSSFKLEREQLVSQANQSQADALSKNMTKRQKYEAEANYRRATDKLEIMATDLQTFLEKPPLSAKIREVMEKAKTLSAAERAQKTADFTKRYKSAPSDGIGSNVEIDTRVQGEQKYFYRNEVDVVNGIITNFDNNRVKDKAIERPGQEAMHLSDIMWQQVREAAEKKGYDIKLFKPKEIHGQAILHDATVKALRPYVALGENKTFSRGDEVYEKVLETVSGKNKLHFLGRYFPDLEISHISVIKGLNPDSINSITYHIVEKQREVPAPSKRKEQKRPEPPLSTKPRFEID